MVNLLFARVQRNVKLPYFKRCWLEYVNDVVAAFKFLVQWKPQRDLEQNEVKQRHSSTVADY